MIAIATALTRCLTEGDVEGVGALYADDAVVWRNLDGRELSKAQVMKVVRFLVERVRDLRYDDVRVLPTPSGFVQQHTLVGITERGQPLRAPACLVVTVERGLITRIDEYLDSAALAPLA
ncbi:MAG: nuclear transport factor 2 family protein [Myxococcales bacterium]|nr:nuclear transport factor 2 family protein [Myxococcales bacterium]